MMIPNILSTELPIVTNGNIQNMDVRQASKSPSSGVRTWPVDAHPAARDPRALAAFLQASMKAAEDLRCQKGQAFLRTGFVKQS